MKTQIQELLHKDMTRHEFLATLGLGLVSMLGFSSVVKFLLEHNSNQKQSQSVASSGYGSGGYGR